MLFWLACPLLVAQDEDSFTPKLRLWSDSTGNHKILATYVQLDGSKVLLEKEDKEIISLPVSRLSREDQQFARKLKAALKTAADFDET